MRGSRRNPFYPVPILPALLLAVLSGPAATAWAETGTAAGIDGHWTGFEERSGRKLTVSLDLLQDRPFHAARVEYFCPMDAQVVETAPGACPICKMPLAARWTPNGSGRFTSESQGVSEYPLDAVSYLSPDLHLELGGGDTVFDGRLSADTIAGTIRQKDGGGTFLLRRERAERPQYTREEVTFTNGRVRLSGTLLLPLSGGLHPAVVLVHGSGPQTRWGTPFFFAERFARDGIAALVFDKRGSGASTGDWRSATYEDLADDVIAAIEFLRSSRGIDPGRVGVYGHSEGAMIAPLIASRSENVAFVIAAAGHAGAILEQELYRVHNLLLDNGFDENDARRALAFYGTWVHVAALGTGWDLLDGMMPEERAQKWFPLVEPPERENWIWKAYPARAAYDSLQYWPRVKVPVLIAFGQADRTVDPATGIGRTVGSLEAAGNRRVSAVILPNARHNLTVAPGPGEPFAWWHLAPGYPELLSAWVIRNVSANRMD